MLIVTGDERKQYRLKRKPGVMPQCQAWIYILTPTNLEPSESDNFFLTNGGGKRECTGDVKALEMKGREREDSRQISPRAGL